jgi:hypothetical protein
MVFELALATPFAVGTLLLLGFVATMFYRNRSNLSDALKRTWIPWLLQILLLFSVIAVATHGEVDWTHQPFSGPNELGLRIENYLAVAAIVFAVVAVIGAKGSRWFATSLMLLQLWLLLCAGAVAEMALTGRWL